MTKQIRSFHTILVANRGEIAARILRTVRRLGYGTVAVYSDADRESPHIVLADCAVHIGASDPASSYLNSAAIIAAALKSGADAIHPGYGFLAENADFADAVDEAGLVFIGPSGAAIRAMANKARAKVLMQEAGVPCVPGYQGVAQDDATFLEAAQGIGWPVMIKAAHGGGGRGMRCVQSAVELPAALASARSEAAQAFGSDELILELAIEAPRHIEVQILADSHGGLVHLGERDCSVQRRHQKLIEEGPSPIVDAALREQMGATARQVARRIDYLGVGTVEFLLDKHGNYYFMEMNTRLQVEHAVTEAITGLDLVEWQLRAAAGEPLDFTQDDVTFNGHAIEVRLTAEDVHGGFLPQSGPVLHWRSPCDVHDVRVDHALATGASVSPYYDSLVAKLIAHGRTRDEARRKLLRALEDCELLGMPTNQAFLADCLQHPDFVQGRVHTGFVQECFPALASQRRQPDPETLAVAALAALQGEAALMDGTQRLAGGNIRPVTTLTWDDKHWQFEFAEQDEGWQVMLASDGKVIANVVLRHFCDRGAGLLRAEIDGVMRYARAVWSDDDLHLFYRGRAWCFQRRQHAASGTSSQQHNGAVCAPLTGRVVDVVVADGDVVQEGEALVVLESMKMEHTLTASIAGTVTDLRVKAGGQTAAGALLLCIVGQAQYEKEAS